MVLFKMLHVAKRNP